MKLSILLILQPFNERLEWFYENLHKDQNPDRPVFDEKSQMMISRGERNLKVLLAS